MVEFNFCVILLPHQQLLSIYRLIVLKSAVGTQGTSLMFGRPDYGKNKRSFLLSIYKSHPLPSCTNRERPDAIGNKKCKFERRRMGEGGRCILNLYHGTLQ